MRQNKNTRGIVRNSVTVKTELRMRKKQIQNPPAKQGANVAARGATIIHLAARGPACSRPVWAFGFWVEHGRK